MLQYGLDKCQQHIHLRFSLQAANGIRGQFVFYAGRLLRVKEKAVVKQQTQDQASAWSFFIQLFGLALLDRDWLDAQKLPRQPAKFFLTLSHTSVLCYIATYWFSGYLPNNRLI